MSIYSCPACDVFPFDTADELIDHINQTHSAAPLPAPTPVYKPAPVPQPVASQPMPAAAPAPAPAQRFVPATDPQKNYLRQLQTQFPGESTLNPDTASKAEASAELDRLTALSGNATSRRSFTPRAQAAPSQQVNVPVGTHNCGGAVFEVKRSKTGNFYALELQPSVDGQGGVWVYVGNRPLDQLSMSTLVRREAA